MNELSATCKSTLDRSTVGNDNFLLGSATLASHGLNLLNDLLSALCLAKDDMFSIKPRGDYRRDKELGPIGVGTGIGHGQEIWAGVLVLEVLIGKLLAVD